MPGAYLFTKKIPLARKGIGEGKERNEKERNEKKVYISTVKLRVVICCIYHSINLLPFRDLCMENM